MYTVYSLYRGQFGLVGGGGWGEAVKGGLAKNSSYRFFQKEPF
jgi:hypothetical protein